MAASLGTVEYNLRVSTDGVREELSRARQSLEDFNGRMGVTANFLRGLFTGFSVQQAVSGFLQINKELANLAELADRAGISLRQIQELRLAAAQTGISGDKFDSGLSSLAAQANKEAREGEGKLKDLIAANNELLRGRNVDLRDTNSLLEAAAVLIANAGTEFDKVDIAKLFGLTEEWVQLLEGGPSALRAVQDEARATGAILDDELVKKAADFDAWWTKAWATFSATAKAAIVEAADALKSSGLLGVNPVGALTGNAATPGYRMGPGGFLIPVEGGAAAGQVPGSPVDYGNPGRGTSAGRPASALAEFYGTTPTTIPSSKKGGGGGSSATETADAVERYLINLEKSRDILAAEVTHWGEATVAIETAKNLEAARAAAKREGRDLTGEEEQKVRDVTAALVNQKEVLESLNSFRQTMLDIAQSVTNALDQWIVRGGKFKDVLANLLQQLASMALQTALLGSNGKSGIFGTLISGVLGAFGGARAAGGTVMAGVPYMVGERGPEMFLPAQSGTIIPNGAMTAGAGGGGVTIVQQFASGVSRSDLADLVPIIEARTKAGVMDALNRGK